MAEPINPQSEDLKAWAEEQFKAIHALIAQHQAQAKSEGDRLHDMVAVVLESQRMLIESQRVNIGRVDRVVDAQVSLEVALDRMRQQFEESQRRHEESQRRHEESQRQSEEAQRRHEQWVREFDERLERTQRQLDHLSTIVHRHGTDPSAHNV